MCLNDVCVQTCVFNVCVVVYCGSPPPQAREAERRENFARLVMLDGKDLVPNPDAVDCRICYLDLQPGEGVLLRECLHCFCRYHSETQETVSQSAILLTLHLVTPPPHDPPPRH